MRQEVGRGVEGAGQGGTSGRVGQVTGQDEQRGGTSEVEQVADVELD